MGDTGSPYLTPLPVSKKSLLTSWILTSTEHLFSKDWMRYMHLGLKPLCFSILSKKLLSTHGEKEEFDAPSEEFRARWKLFSFEARYLGDSVDKGEQIIQRDFLPSRS
jgi:hypothetical protein